MPVPLERAPARILMMPPKPAQLTCFSGPSATRARVVLAALLLFCSLAGGPVEPTAAELASGHRRVITTDNYRIYSDLPPRITRELVAELEHCHTDYSRRLSVFGPAQGATTEGLRGRMNRRDEAISTDVGRYDVHLFATQAGYVHFTGGELPNSAGAFHPGRRALCAFIEGQGTAELKQTLRHEAFHQFAYEHLGPRVPLWVNEGMAQLFEYGVRVGDELLMGQVPPDTLREVRQAIETGRLIDFRDIITLDDRGWARNMADREYGGLMYAQAWAMVHFLVYAADESGRPIYRDRFNAFLKEMADGMPGRIAFREHFGTNLDGFRKRFEAYTLALRPTAVAHTADQQDVLARMLILLHQRGIHFDTLDEFETYVRKYSLVLHRTRNGVTWQTDADPGVYFLDARGRPLGPRRLRFMLDPVGDLPALVRIPGDGLIYTTRFYRLGGELYHETTLERE